MERLGGLAFWISASFLTSRPLLWTLFIVNLLGTVYGYQWYAEQLAQTLSAKPTWMVLYVPDSPTASLLFTLSLLPLLRNNQPITAPTRSSWVGLIQTAGAVASVKYGVWAVAMIASGYSLGEPVGWEGWMLSASHLGMAAEALLFVRFFRVTPAALMITAVWVISNDIIDYRFGVFPWLSELLHPYLDRVQLFTLGLSVVSVSVVWLLHKSSRQSRV